MAQSNNDETGDGMESLLQLENIVKTFPGVVALDDMNFDLRKGEIHSICGENGAGKSTLMKIVTGVYQPDRGDIKLSGKKISLSDPLDAFEQGISIIYQETSLFEEMTVLENLFLGHELQKKAMGIFPINDYTEMRKRVLQIFRKLHTDISPDEKIKNLGMAQKQMVEIAKALTFEAKILILDEPTASLTDREVQALFNIIRELKDEGVGVVYISHRLEEIFELCDRVTVVRDGKFISTKIVCETNKDALVADMVGRSMGNYYPKAQVEIGEELLSVKGFFAGKLLKNIEMHIKKGEILGFAGLAGSGRTEFAEALCGIAPKDQGEIKMNGEKIRIENYEDAMNAGIVYVSEDRGKFGLVLEMSVKENISLPQISSLVSGLVIDQKKEGGLANNYIQEMGIKAPNYDFLVENLSGGNQQKVSVSRALALKPKLLILDEPTRGVDVNAKAEIHKIISELAQSGLTIMMISSELPELLGMCDRIYVMQDGEINGCLDRAEATQANILKMAIDSNTKGGEQA